MKTNKNLIILALVVAMVILAVFILSFKSNKTSITPPVLQSNTTVGSREKTKTYESKKLNFRMEVPRESDIEEKQTYVDIMIRGMLIDIVRNGTNFGSLRAYLRDSDAKKKVVIVADEKALMISGYEVVRRTETNTGSGTKQNLYYIYIDNWVYILSTSSESLFPALDQIAQSFRYTP